MQARTIIAERPDHVWHVDLTTVPTAAGFWCSWSPVCTAAIRRLLSKTPPLLLTCWRMMTQSVDLDPTSVQIGAVPTNGNTAVDPVTGVITYTPNANFAGTDSFTYTFLYGEGSLSNSATVTVTVGSTLVLNQANSPRVGETRI